LDRGLEGAESPELSVALGGEKKEHANTTGTICISLGLWANIPRLIGILSGLWWRSRT